MNNAVIMQHLRGKDKLQKLYNPNNHCNLNLRTLLFSVTDRSDHVVKNKKIFFANALKKPRVQ